MTQSDSQSNPENSDHVGVIGPNGQPLALSREEATAAAARAAGTEGVESGETALSDMVEQPAKVMRIGTIDRKSVV